MNSSFAFDELVVPVIEGVSRSRLCEGVSCSRHCEGEARSNPAKEQLHSGLLHFVRNDGSGMNMQMKHLVWLLVVVLASCGGGRSSSDSSSDGDGQGEISIAVDTIAVLPEGELHISDADFGEIIELTGVSHPVDEIFRVSETEMIVKDSLLIMKNMSPADKDFLMVFSLPDFNFVASAGIRGNGPMEFNFPYLVESDVPGILCYIFESSKKKMYSFDDHFEIAEMGINGELSEKLKKRPDQFRLLNDTTFLFADNVKGGKAIFELRCQSDTVSISRAYEIAFSKTHKNWAAYIGNLGVNVKYNRAVYAYNYFRRLRFFDTGRGTVRDVIFDEKEKGKESDIGTLAPTNVTYYWKISPQGKYIYCLYSGRTPIEVTNEKNKGITYIFIEQFDWNGTPIRKFKLDHWGYFCVDEKENAIYLVSTDEEHPFYTYQMP